MHVKSYFSQHHLVNRYALSRFGRDEDLVGSLGLLALPGELGHCTEEATSAHGRRNLSKFFGDFIIESKLLELGEAQVDEVVLPTHELGLIVSNGKLDVFTLFEWRGGVKGEGPLSNGL